MALWIMPLLPFVVARLAAPRARIGRVGLPVVRRGGIGVLLAARLRIARGVARRVAAGRRPRLDDELRALEAAAPERLAQRAEAVLEPARERRIVRDERRAHVTAAHGDTQPRLDALIALD